MFSVYCGHSRSRYDSVKHINKWVAHQARPVLHPRILSGPAFRTGTSCPSVYAEKSLIMALMRTFPLASDTSIVPSRLEFHPSLDSMARASHRPCCQSRASQSLATRARLPCRLPTNISREERMCPDCRLPITFFRVRLDVQANATWTPLTTIERSFRAFARGLAAAWPREGAPLT